MKSEIADNKQKQKAIFLDRDGVINVEKSYISKPEELEVFDFTPGAIKKINTSVYKAIVITNQSAIARNMCTVEELSAIHKKMATILQKEDAKVDAIYFCPHHPDKNASKEKTEYTIDCDCRKPKPGMLLNAAKDFNIDLQQSIMIGDTERDILSGKNAGCYTAGVITGYGLKSTKTFPDFIFTDLMEATSFLTDKENELLFKNTNTDFNKSAEPFIIGIDGPEYSKKSNIASYLKMRFEQIGKKVLLLSTDDWTLPNPSEKSIGNEIKLILSDNSRTIKVQPKYPNASAINLNFTISKCQVIIIEGTNLFKNKSIQDLCAKKLLIANTKEKNIMRIKKFYNWLEKTDKDFKKSTDSLRNQDKNLKSGIEIIQ